MTEPLAWTDITPVVKKAVAYVPVSQEAFDDRLPPFEDIMRGMEERARLFGMLPREEQERIRADEAAAHEARRCPTCGHHPDED